jgi:hypothetical protein
LAPGVTDTVIRVHDHESLTPLGQVVANRETRLATADNHSLDVCWLGAHRSRPLSAILVITRQGRTSY